MTQDNVNKLAQPRTSSDPLTEVLRNGARALLAQAVEAEVAIFLDDHAAKLTVDHHQRLVHHGHLPAYQNLGHPRGSSSSPLAIGSYPRDKSSAVKDR